MNTWTHLFIWLTALSALGLAVSSLCRVLAWFVVKRQDVRTAAPDSVTLLKPLCGRDVSLDENLETFADQSHRDLHIVFGVADANDPARDVAERFCATHPTLSTRVSVGEAPDTVNPKVALLERMSRQTNGDWLVVSDSNVRVAPGYVTEALSHATPEVGLITHLVSGVGGDSAAAHCENLHLNTFIAPAICGARFLASRTCVVGKSMFLRRDVLDQLGGFRSAGDFLAEDYALGQAVERAGYRVATSSVPVSAWHEGWTFKRFFNRHVRWAVMRRRISVLGYLAELLVSPGPVLNLLLLVGWVAQVSPGTLGWVTTGLVLEALMAWVTYWRISGRCMSWQALLCKPLRDGLALGIWILGWFVQRIEWRAKTYRIGAQTVLQAAPVTLAEGIIDEPYH